MRLNFLLIPLVTVIVAILGGMLTSSGLGQWYSSLSKPVFTPPGSLIGLVWTTIYIMATISALIVWNSHVPWGQFPRDSSFRWIFAIFLLNAFLNVFWSYLFFVRHELFMSLLDALALGLTAIALAVMTWRISPVASVLMWPYACWVAFASWLNHTIAAMN